MYGVVLDTIALALPVLFAISAVRHWRITMKITLAASIVGLPFTPAWDTAWIFLSQNWHNEQASAATELVPNGAKRLSLADLARDARPEPLIYP